LFFKSPILVFKYLTNFSVLSNIFLTDGRFTYVDLSFMFTDTGTASAVILAAGTDFKNPNP
jgi:hypothetical protein